MVDKVENSEQINAVRGILLDLEKTIKVFQMYEDNHPLTLKALDKFYEKINGFLNQNENLVLRVAQFEFFYQENLVYQNLERSFSLAFKLFRDGLRGIGFEKGLTSEELIAVIKLFTTDFSQNAEDDIVTKLWELNLPHVQYWEAEDELQPPAEIEMKIFEKSPTVAQESDINPEFEISLEDVALTTEEIQQMKEEINLVEKAGLAVDLVDIVEYIIKTEEDPMIKNQLIDNAPGLVFNLLARNNFAALNRYLKLLRNIKDYINEIDLKTQKLIQNIFTRLETDFVILNLAPELERGNTDVETFLSFLSKNIIDPLFRLLENLTRVAGQEIVIKTLARLTRDDKGPVIKRLEDPDEKKVMMAISVLEAIGDQESVEYIKKTLGRVDRGLRRFIIETITRVQSPAVRDILIDSLYDPDIDIRLLALKQISQTNDDYFLSPLLKILKDKKFKQKEIEERQMFLYTFADCGQNRAIAYLARILKKWRLFMTKKIRAEKQIAAFALARINDPEARSVLSDGLKSRNRTIRELCTKALVLTRKRDDQT